MTETPEEFVKRFCENCVGCENGVAMLKFRDAEIRKVVEDETAGRIGTYLEKKFNPKRKSVLGKIALSLEEQDNILRDLTEGEWRGR